MVKIFFHDSEKEESFGIKLFCCSCRKVLLFKDIIFFCVTRKVFLCEDCQVNEKGRVCGEFLQYQHSHRKGVIL